MNIQKIINKLKYILKKKFVGSNRNKLILSRIKETSFYHKRRSFVIKNDHLEKLKFFWNNTKSYYLIIALGIIFTIIYIIFWPIFKVKYIEITKQDNITNMSISYKSVESYRWKSIWDPEKKDILINLQNYQQNIRDIKLNYKLPDTLKIKIDSYKWVFNTTINDKTFIITENGTLIPTQYSTDLNELIVKKVFDKGQFFDYKQLLDWKYINQIFYTKKLLEENLINIKIKNIIYYVIERELHIETENETIIIIDLDSDTKLQVEKLAIYNKEQFDIEKNPMVYIDLRINNKIFYCTTENKLQCIKNLKSIYWE